jgi:hypothetical protein
MLLIVYLKSCEYMRLLLQQVLFKCPTLQLQAILTLRLTLYQHSSATIPFRLPNSPA